MRRHLPIIAVLGAAVLLRTWGISFGLPHTLIRPDEEAVISVALRFFRRIWNPGFFDWPSLFMYAVAAGFVAYFNIGRRAGTFPYEITFVSAASANPTPLYMIARSLSAFAGVVTVWTAHRVGVLLFDATTALVGALFLAVAALHVRDSHFGMTDIAATCLLLQSFLSTVRAARGGTRRDLYVSALWAGLAASTKYNAGLVALAAAWLILSGGLAGLDSWKSRVRLGVGYAGVAVLAFVAGTPYAFLDPQPFLAALGRISEHLREGHAAFAGYGWLVHLSSSLRYGIGVPMLVAGVAGLVLYCTRDRKNGVLFAIFPVAYFLLIGSGQTTFARYIIPVVPFLCLAAAHATVDVSRRLALNLGRPRLAPSAVWLLAALVAAPSALSAIQTDILLSRTDNRLLAAAWIHDRYPTARMHQTGATYAAVQMQTVEPMASDHYRDVAFDESERVFRDQDGSVTVPPDLVVVPECPLAYCGAPESLRNILSRDYHLEQTFRALDTAASDLVYDRDDAFFVPLAGFGGVSRPGPNLYVYVRRAP